ncbi:hypothetical protein glysoja_042420 [Glycine soja]|uniref:Uncharacterized protein n=1 Tax=Glycine soja TaxID=3848 RepID=A0A0B2SE38_GLYSO|nr:hypothetical protein glysoja_042420 [Glycine soja]
MSTFMLKIFLLISIFQISFATRRLNELVQDQTQLLRYHNGPLLSGKISINLIWYGHFKPSQKAIVSDFITSLSPSSPHSTQPSVATWWKTTEKYYHHLSNTKKTSPLSIPLNKQILDENYSLGKSLTSKHLIQLASKGDHKNAINVVLTFADVAVEGAYPGYAGNLNVDSSTGASYNAHGANGRKYLLPALYDPATSSCSTLVQTFDWEDLLGSVMLSTIWISTLSEQAESGNTARSSGVAAVVDNEIRATVMHWNRNGSSDLEWNWLADQAYYLLVQSSNI